MMDSNTNSADYTHLHIWLVNDPQVHVSHFHKDQLKKARFNDRLDWVAEAGGSHGGIMSHPIPGDSCLCNFFSSSQNWQVRNSDSECWLFSGINMNSVVWCILSTILTCTALLGCFKSSLAPKELTFWSLRHCCTCPWFVCERPTLIVFNGGGERLL